MAREIVPGIHWIQECGPDRGGGGDLAVHVPQHAYLLDGTETLLFDTLSPASTDHVLAELDGLVDGLDYLVPSHPDVPHAGNTRAILDAYPGAELVAPRYGSGHELYHLDDALKVGEGDGIDLGGLEVTFHESAFPDSAVHLWMSERTTDTLFTVDWCGFPHLEDECALCVEEFERDVSVDRLVNLHEFVLFWLKYVDVERVEATVDRLVERFEPAVLAPAHGNPVREGAVEHVLKMKEATARIREAEDERARVEGTGEVSD
jgi:flavorubredoxin